MKKIDNLSVGFHDRKVGTLSLSPDSRMCIFQYDKEWLVDGFSISPLQLPLKSETFIATPAPFRGGFGVFEDSLPDGYGRYLLHKALLKEGIDDSTLSVLDRLSLVGIGGMGALTYTPVTKIFDGEETDDFDMLQAKALEILREKQSDDAALLLFNSGNSGGARPKALFSDDEGRWLVKFRHIYDPEDIGQQEFKYHEAARICGIKVPDFKLIGGKYFASKRFDIAKSDERIHVATSGGILDIPLGNPVLDYSNLLALTGYLTQDKEEVEEMYRRMVFNYLTENKHDHCKNFSFMVICENAGEWRWRLAPAYDLTHNPEGYNGQHATSVNGTGHPLLSDFIEVGRKIRITPDRCRQLIEQVADNCPELIRYRIK